VSVDLAYLPQTTTASVCGFEGDLFQPVETEGQKGGVLVGGVILVKGVSLGCEAIIDRVAVWPAVGL
jgi:hypothetical protein